MSRFEARVRGFSARLVHAGREFLWRDRMYVEAACKGIHPKEADGPYNLSRDLAVTCKRCLKIVDRRAP